MRENTCVLITTLFISSIYQSTCCALPDRQTEDYLQSDVTADCPASPDRFQSFSNRTISRYMKGSTTENDIPENSKTTPEHISDNLNTNADANLQTEPVINSETSFDTDEKKAKIQGTDTRITETNTKSENTSVNKPDATSDTETDDKNNQIKDSQEIKTDTKPVTDSENKPDAPSGTETDSKNNQSKDSETQEVKPDTKPVTDSENKPDTQTSTETDGKNNQSKDSVTQEVKPDTKPVTDSESKTDTTSGTETDSKNNQSKDSQEIKTDTKPVTDSESKTDTTSGTETDGKNNQSKDSQEIKTDTKPVTDSENKTDTTSGTETDGKNNQSKDSDTQEVKPETKPVTDSDNKPDASGSNNQIIKPDTDKKDNTGEEIWGDDRDKINLNKNDEDNHEPEELNEGDEVIISTIMENYKKIKKGSPNNEELFYSNLVNGRAEFNTGEGYRCTDKQYHVDLVSAVTALKLTTISQKKEDLFTAKYFKNESGKTWVVVFYKDEKPEYVILHFRPVSDKKYIKQYKFNQDFSNYTHSFAGHIGTNAMTEENLSSLLEKTTPVDKLENYSIQLSHWIIVTEDMYILKSQENGFNRKKRRFVEPLNQLTVSTSARNTMETLIKNFDFNTNGTVVLIDRAKNNTYLINDDRDGLFHYLDNDGNETKQHLNLCYEDM